MNYENSELFSSNLNVSACVSRSKQRGEKERWDGMEGEEIDTKYTRDFHILKQDNLAKDTSIIKEGIDIRKLNILCYDHGL